MGNGVLGDDTTDYLARPVATTKRMVSRRTAYRAAISAGESIRSLSR